MTHSDRILLSAARPGQGGLGHLNEQQPGYCIELMSARDFALAPQTQRYRDLPDHFAANTLFFERTYGSR